MNIENRIGKFMGAGRSWYQRSVGGIKWLTVHHTASQATGTDDQVMQNEANHHINGNGWAGLSYHFFISKSGKIYQINNLSDLTYHDAVNVDSIGIVLAGYFHSPVNEKPTDAQLKALRYLLDQLCTQHPEFPADQSNVVPHKMRSSTACCGDNAIGYPNDYRNTLGKVSWGNYGQPDVPPTTGYTQEQVNKLIAEAVKKVKDECAALLAEKDKQCQQALQDYKKKVLEIAEKFNEI